MKRFLAVFDGFQLSESTLSYALQLSKTLNASLTGVFLDEFIYRNYDVVKVIRSGSDYEKVMADLDQKDQKRRDDAVRQFHNACSKAGITFEIHRDKSLALQELQEESMFADLVIIDEYETFSRHKEEPPTRFIKDLLSDVQCPVLVVPNNYKKIDEIVLLYDGRPSSLYAIKQFSYLLGEFQDLPLEVLTVNEQSENLHLPDNKRMKDFIKSMFPQATFTVKDGSAEEQIVDHLREHQENELVVLGAYRRTELSRWFKTSMADILMRNLDTPLFIAHNK